MTVKDFHSIQIEELPGALVVRVPESAPAMAFAAAEQCVRHDYHVAGFTMPHAAGMYFEPTVHATGVEIDGRRVLARCQHFAAPGECLIARCKHFITA